MFKAAKQRFLDIIEPRVQAYKQTFRGVYAATVLRDLEKFCRGTETCFHPDARMHAVLEGRREVWLRIQKHLQLTPEQIFSLRLGETQTMESDDGRRE